MNTLKNNPYQFVGFRNFRKREREREREERPIAPRCHHTLSKDGFRREWKRKARSVASHVTSCQFVTRRTQHFVQVITQNWHAALRCRCSRYSAWKVVTAPPLSNLLWKQPYKGLTWLDKQRMIIKVTQWKILTPKHSIETELLSQIAKKCTSATVYMF